MKGKERDSPFQSIWQASPGQPAKTLLNLPPSWACSLGTNRASPWQPRRPAQSMNSHSVFGLARPQATRGKWKGNNIALYLFKKRKKKKKKKALHPSPSCTFPVSRSLVTPCDCRTNWQSSTWGGGILRRLKFKLATHTHTHTPTRILTGQRTKRKKSELGTWPTNGPAHQSASFLVHSFPVPLAAWPVRPILPASQSYSLPAPSPPVAFQRAKTT